MSRDRHRKRARDLGGARDVGLTRVERIEKYQFEGGGASFGDSDKMKQKSKTRPALEKEKNLSTFSPRPHFCSLSLRQANHDNQESTNQHCLQIKRTRERESVEAEK